MNLKPSFPVTVFTVLCVIFLFGCEKVNSPVNEAGVESTPADPSAEAAAAVTLLADDYYSVTLQRTPEIAYFSGVELLRHDGMQDNSPSAQLASEDYEDKMLAALERIDVDTLNGRTEWITHAYLLQTLRANVAQRICRNQLWNVNQMGGWHSGYSQIAQLQPVGSPTLREQSVARWSKMAAYINQEIENLKSGLELGYSAPRTVVQRVIDQVGGLLELEIEESPFYSPAIRDDDTDFAATTRAIVSTQIYPALQRYRDFLANIYMENARAELTVTANPDGSACYEASLQAYTTLDRSGREVFELGQVTVAANRAKVIE
ncbi:MAG: DUF885 domain-containing protein, partial [Gammaproteobacteria bacterium]|nr:DUF885 domain-containing protein [Gammaproteobacteria bacterium]